MDLNNNTILITGGTSGIGRALAEAFHQRKNQVIIAGRRQALLDEIAAKNPGIQAVRVDLESPDSIDLFAKEVNRRFPNLNILINNAGVSQSEDLNAQTVDLSTARSIIETNIVSVLHVTAALLPTLRKQPHSTIMTTSSGLAFLPLAHFPTYCASKAFLHSWLQSLRAQLANKSIDVIELVAPYVQTELSGPGQATDPNAMPLADYIAELLQMLGEPVPANGEIVSRRASLLRSAEKSGEYEKIYKNRNQL